MKIRNGFISNSSSSSYILSQDIDIDEVKEFCKKEIIIETQKSIEKAEKTHFPDNWKEYIQMLKNDMLPKNLERNINIEKVKDIEWDLSEWFSNLDPEDYVLYDEDDNYLNWISKEITSKYNVKQYVLHM